MKNPFASQSIYPQTGMTMLAPRKAMKVNKLVFQKHLRLKTEGLESSVRYHYSTEHFLLNQLHSNPFLKGHFFVEDFNESHSPCSQAGNKALMSVKCSSASYQHLFTEITIY